jgi:hypothetical protein
MWLLALVAPGPGARDDLRLDQPLGRERQSILDYGLPPRIGRSKPFEYHTSAVAEPRVSLHCPRAQLAADEAPEAPV